LAVFVPVVVAKQQLDALLGGVEDCTAATGQPDPFFKCLERLFQRQVALFQSLHELTQPIENLIEPWLFGFHWGFRRGFLLAGGLWH
jgi:hypothetical protein